MFVYLLTVFMVLTQMGCWAHRLDSRFELTSFDVRMRCCHNRWIKCCTIYPWQGQGGNIEEQPEGSASGSGSGSGLGSGAELEPLYPDTEACKKYKHQHYGAHYGDRCLNSYIVLKDLAKIKNDMARYYRCNAEKDEEFYNALVNIDKDITPDALRCCVKHHTKEGVDLRVADSVGNILIALNKLEEQYKRHQSLPWFPSQCLVYGHRLTIEDKMSEAIWQMGLLIRCGKEVTCPL